MKTQKIKQLAALVGLACGMASMSTFAGTIKLSKHDFSANAWSGGEICVVCHTPHAAENVASAPLWNHAASTVVTYQTYTGFDMDSTAGQPAGVSLLCLSCHDGSVAIDSFGGKTGGTTIAATADIGDGINNDNLTNDHPISMNYATAQATDGELHPAATGAVNYGDGTGGFIADLLDANGDVQCSSCHDVHNTKTDGSAGLLVVSNTASGLCLTCHAK